MSVRFRVFAPQSAARLGPLLLIWALCAAVVCPAAWQSLSASLRGAGAASETASAAAVAPTDWMWESFSPDGRQSALSSGRLAPVSQELRHEARLVPTRDARSAPDAAPVGLVSRFSACTVLPEPELLPVTWGSDDPTPRLPATRGLFCRPPPSLKA